MSDYPLCGDPFCTSCRQLTYSLLRRRTRPRLASSTTESVPRYTGQLIVPWPWLGGEERPEAQVSPRRRRSTRRRV